MPKKLRAEVLMANRHMCCVCQKGLLQVHHIDGNNSNNVAENLAVLCMQHHDMATAPKGLSARLTEVEVRKYKHAHEGACKVMAHKLARGRTAFFMVDYKNVERIYQIFIQLTSEEYERAYTVLVDELQEEDTLRKEQGFDCSLEPTTKWNQATQKLLEYVRQGIVHPEHLSSGECHEYDRCLPTQMPHKAYHDVWVQLLVRAILVCRRVLPLEDIMSLESPLDADLSGALVTVEGKVRGEFFDPYTYKKDNRVQTAFFQESDHAKARARLHLKKHYVYSNTAAQNLTKGRTQGLVYLRSIDSIKKSRDSRTITFSCTPLILGAGGGGPLAIP